MQTVVETPQFIRAAKNSGMTQDEIDDLIMLLADNPDSGVEMPGTGGFRKVRHAKTGKGKRGGYRAITFYSGINIPVFLIDVFAKNERSDLSKSEQNALKAIGKEIVDTYKMMTVLRRVR